MHFEITVIAVLVLAFSCLQLLDCKNILSGKEEMLIWSNSNLVSPDGSFELGFFNAAPRGNHWYIAIWYKKIPERTYVWVANRNRPLSSSNGSLKVSDGRLVLYDLSNKNEVWSTPSGTQRRSLRDPVVVAELLSNGNFVLRDSSRKDYLWQSFDEPTNTLLPGMALNSSLKGTNYVSRRYLKCWIKTWDPAEGPFSYGLNDHQFPRLQILGDKGDIKRYRSGAWNGVAFTGVPLEFKLRRIGDDSVFTYQANNNSYSRVTLTPEGSLEFLTWNQTRRRWNKLWYAPRGECDQYNHCGANMYCDEYTSPMCNCIGGYEPQSANVTKGCVRKTATRPRCNGNKFDRLLDMKLPDTEGANQFFAENLVACEEKCQSDCQCTAYTLTAYQNGSFSTNCVNWSGDLLDVRNYSGAGQDLYVKMNGNINNKKNHNMSLIIGLSVGGGIGAVIVLALVVFWVRKRKLERRKATATLQESEASRIEMAVVTSHGDMLGADTIEIHPVDYAMVLKATDNFSNEIGEGGFGKVYKGKLHDGQEIAVKRLSEMSKQGPKEFYTEVKLISTLQHVNIVRLLGWSLFEDEMVLIYEYLANGSLESHLFGGSHSADELNWQVRFDIIKGIARGLAYMEEGSRDMIIHRDLKPGNILLDENMTPKISDFGLARICQRSGNQFGETKVVGTFGFMSPEYAASGSYSRKSDIFSFGVTVLETVCGKQNKSFFPDSNLPSYVWAKWTQGKWEETLDPVIRYSLPFPRQQVQRCIEVGILCVQHVPHDRPDMTLVETMLASQSHAIPHLGKPGFFMGQTGN